MKNLIIPILVILLSVSVISAGTDFDCRSLGISIDKCYTQNGKFTAEMSIKGVNLPESHGKVLDVVKGIDYVLDTEKQYTTINNDVVARGGLPENYELKNTKGEDFVLTAEMGDNVVKSLRVAYTTDDYYEYNHEMEYCFLKAKEDKEIDMYGFKRCEDLGGNEVVENKITAEVVKEPEVVEEPVEEKSNLLYILLGIGLVLIIVGIIIVKKRK